MGELSAATQVKLLRFLQNHEIRRVGETEALPDINLEVYRLNGDEGSPDFGKWESFILSDENKHQLYIPPMYANGFYVLSDAAVYTYKQSSYYGEYKQFSFKYNDPRFGIRWPAAPEMISERDG